MPVYRAPLDDLRFILNDVVNFNRVTEIPAFAEATPDLVEAILTEGGRVCEEVYFPLNMSGDQEGCHYNGDEHSVAAPKGFMEAYKTYVEGGWGGLSSDPEYGGQGLPQTLNTIMAELISSANLAFGMYPGLTQGAVNALKAFGSDEQKQKYLPKMISGEWGGTMNLTEPQCGTDLGLIRTKAEPIDGEEGAYAITGTKIWISAGEHDLTDNIIHLVLAKLPDAPEGVKGISLFVVPKFFVNEDGSLGERNKAFCGGLEHKMGIHASPTCVMNYDGAKGWLVGEPHKGLRAMFVMMNEARLHVGMQGLGIGEVAYQNAVQFARERLQGRGLDGTKAPDKPADPIIVHPDVRRNLMIMKAFTEGARALAAETAIHIDIAHSHEDADTRRKSKDFVSLMTPIIKAYFTDMGSEAANLAVQTYGGSGYCQEYGVEQYVRDARITMIYEGTNGIQALDLVGRKMGKDFGQQLRAFFQPTEKLIKQYMEDEHLAEYAFPLYKSFSKLQQATVLLAQKGMKNPLEAGAAATDYLRMFALVVMGTYWLRMAAVAKEKLDTKDTATHSNDFYQAKLDTATFFMTRMLPEVNSRFTAMNAGADTLMALDEEQFMRA